MGYSIESVRLIRDKNTGRSKGFGFVKFFSIEHSKAFMNAVMKEPLCIDGFYLKPDYSNTSLEDWKCSSVLFFNLSVVVSIMKNGKPALNVMGPEALKKIVKLPF